MTNSTDEASDALVLAEGDEVELVAAPEPEPEPAPAPKTQLAPPEETRQPSADSAFEVLGELLKKSPAFAEYIKKRALASRPVLTKVSRTKTRQWAIGFGPEEIPAGGSRVLVQRVEMLFRGENLICVADDDAGLYVTGIFVGQKSQFPIRMGPTPFAMFAPNALGSGYKFDTCEAGLNISIMVQNTSRTPKKVSITMFGATVL